MSGMHVKGMHHVSAMTGDAKGNLDFYTRILGMRLVKKTVNQDDTSVYHLFYGDERGNAGTELTFFDFRHLGQTVEGTNSISSVSFRVPNDDALRYWENRLTAFNVNTQPTETFAGRKILRFRDPEGQRLALVSDETNEGVAGGQPWNKSPVPVKYGIRGLGPVKLTVQDQAPTLDILNMLGFTEKTRLPALKAGQQDIVVLQTGAGGSGAEVQLEQRTDLARERLGKGGVHHVAFRVADKDELMNWIEIVQKARIPNSGFVERFYFSSLYFREPNGILFELATDGPGFDTDEPLEHLGETLALPPFLEPQREKIEAKLMPLDTSNLKFDR